MVFTQLCIGVGGSRILGTGSYPLLTEYKPITRLLASNRVIVTTSSWLVPVIGSDRLTAVNRLNEFSHKDQWIPLSNQLLPSNRLLPSVANLLILTEMGGGGGMTV